MFPGGGAVQAVRGAGRGPGGEGEVEASRAFGQVQVLELYGLAATRACASAICEARAEGLVFVVVGGGGGGVVCFVVVGGGGVGGGGDVGFVVFLVVVVVVVVMWVLLLVVELV